VDFEFFVRSLQHQVAFGRRIKQNPLCHTVTRIASFARTIN